MRKIDFKWLLKEMKGKTVERPNKADSGTLSGHAAGEPFEKCVYHILKEKYPDKIFKQYEYLNDLYLRNPQSITVEQRKNLVESPTALFLISRSKTATKAWNPENIFEEKQDDTADIIYYQKGFYDIIDVKTRNSSKRAMAPNIISAYKLANLCAYMIDNQDYDNIDIDYVEVDWLEENGCLKCTDVHHANLFKAEPIIGKNFYINWTSGTQLQFHVCDLDQSWADSKEKWARQYLKEFVKSAEHRCKYMRDTYITPFLKYIEE